MSNRVLLPPHRRLLYAAALELCDWLTAHFGRNWALTLLRRRTVPVAVVHDSRRLYDRIQTGHDVVVQEHRYDNLYAVCEALGFAPGQAQPVHRSIITEHSVPS